VEDCLAGVPKNVTFYGRDPNTDYVVEPGRTGFAAFGQCVNVLDPATAELRPAGKADMARSAILKDALENLRTTARTVAAGDQYPPAQAVHCMDAIVRNTGKHISGGAGNRQNLDMIIQLLEVAAAGPQRFQQRPFYSPSVCPTSPLTLGKDSCEVAISAANAGLTVVIMIMPLAGGTAPVTLAGTIIQGLAEQLGGLVLVQLVRKATPVTLGSATTIMDLKTGLGAMGAPGKAF
jgi:trimethylamine--corrinoid protein Co-methyltransferase